MGTGTRHHRWAVRAAGTAVVGAVLLGLTPGTAVAAPSDEEIAAAEAERDAAAAEVGVLSAQLAEAEAAAARAHQTAQIALQDYEETQAAYEAARAAADTAAAAAVQADADVVTGRGQLAAYARDTYIQGSTAPGASALLTAGGPAQLIERAALLEAAGTHRVDVVGELVVLQERAVVARQEAQAASAQAETLQAQAAVALEGAQAQELSAREQTAALAGRRDAVAARAAAAGQEVTELQAEQDAAERAAAEAAAAAARAAAARAAAAPPAPVPQAAPAPRPAPQAPVPAPGPAPQAPAPAPAPAPTGTPTPPPTTTAGAPSASAAQRAIDAAMSQRGLPYSWGGGGSGGPSYGIPPDTGIYGFDCSGLTEYAYARAGIAIGGTSRDQWWRNRGKTVARGDLRPGDLVFWGSGSAYTSIYHVALYIGDGKVVHAPQSGDVVKVAPMWFGSTYFGAVRPSA